MRRLFLFAALFLVANQALAQRDFSKVQVKASHVAGSVYMLEGSGGNIGVSLGSDGILMVDDQFEPLADKIRAALGKLGEGKLRFVLNTHYHGDHVGGNVVFGPEAPIIAHANVRKRLATPQQMWGQTRDPLPHEALPVITFDDGLSVHFNGEEIRVIHLPHGHTDGDSVVHFTGSNVVHMGDLMFAGLFPYVDLEHGGDVRGYIDNVASLIRRLPEDVKLIPGHGPLATLDDLKASHRMMVDTTRLVEKRMQEGKSLEEIQKEGLPEAYASFDWQFISTDLWIQTIYESLSGKSATP